MLMHDRSSADDADAMIHSLGDNSTCVRQSSRAASATWRLIPKLQANDSRRLQLVPMQRLVESYIYSKYFLKV
jgi:hypothetical protein